MPQLEKKIVIEGKIIAVSGIMVGGSNSAIEIGGVDKQVVRNPITKLPYIPGSTLKGKMRSLLELVMGQVSPDDKEGYGPTHNPNHISAQLFGYIKHKDNNKQSQRPSRLIVRDAELDNSDIFFNNEIPFVEIKAENTIDRITAIANPRFFERVPKGAEFNLSIILNIFKDDKDKNLYLSTVFNALRLVQNDYLGGAGSRGNGQVKFKIINIFKHEYPTHIEGGYEKLDIPSDFM
jgi:CRISPR-associated protein Csm3